MNDLNYAHPLPEENNYKRRASYQAPHDSEAEKAILGEILEGDDELKKLPFLKATHFYVSGHKTIFKAILKLEKEGKPIDPITVGDQIKKKDETSLKTLGGYRYLAELMELAPISGNIVYYARIVEDFYIQRQLIKEARSFQKTLKKPDINLEETIEDMRGRLTKISEKTNKETAKELKDLFVENFKRIEFLSDMPDDVAGLATGFTEFDKLTTGLYPGQFIILAARPGMGKTSLAMNMAVNVAKSGGKVAVFSLEMQATQISLRLLAAEAEVNSRILKTGQLEPDDWESLAVATDKLSPLNIFIEDQSGLNMKSISINAKRLVNDYEKLDLIIIDYLQLIREDQSGKILREQEVATISRDCKALAKDLGVPVIGICQLNRSVETRTNKRPAMADLRESGALEQDADLICFIYRDEVYNENSEHKGIAELITAKQRDGDTGTVRLAFRKEYTKFNNLAPEPTESLNIPDDIFD